MNESQESLCCQNQILKYFVGVFNPDFYGLPVRSSQRPDKVQGEAHCLFLGVSAC